MPRSRWTKGPRITQRFSGTAIDGCRAARIAAAKNAGLTQRKLLKEKHAVQTKQEFRWVVALVEERMASRSIAVQAFKVELWAAGIVQFRRIGIGSQDGPVSRNIVSHKLAEDGPTSGCVTQ